MKRWLGSYDEDIEGEEGEFVKYEEAQAIITSLKAQLAERDKTILEQHARIVQLIGHIPGNTHYLHARMDEKAKQALEAALKAERIKTLEDAEKHLILRGLQVKFSDELRRMANELKEQS